MACDVNTLERLAYSTGLPKMGSTDLLYCLSSIYGTKAGFSTAQTALNNAYSKGLNKVSERDLWMMLEAAIC